MKAEPARASEAVETHELAKLSAIDLLAGYRAGRFTPRDVIEDVIAALESTQASCNVVVTPMYEQARAAADEATAAWASGRKPAKLAGVPVTIKDLVYVAGVPALGGAPANRDFVPAADAAVVTALKSAGAIVTCKTTTCESGYKLTADSPVSGITRNPWDQARTSGGSSGGGRRRCRRRLRPARDRHRWRRIDPGAVLFLRRGRAEADLRAGAEVAGIFPRRPGRRWRIPARSPGRWPTRPCCWR